MRRKEREVMERKDIEAFLSSERVVRIALSDRTAPYIVPMSFGYEWKGELPVLYLHSALKGRKIELLCENSCVGFELDRLDALEGGDAGCSWTARYFSIIGEGKLEEVAGNDEKMRALHILLSHQAGRDFPIPEKALSSVLVLRLSVSSMSAKSNR